MSHGNENSIHQKMENVFSRTCGSWKNCTEASLQSFLEECPELSIDPQYCMSWVEQHQEQIQDWETTAKAALDWMNEHSSTGSPVSGTE
jgi:predicted HicB family RNase H-like nuclease